MSAGRHRDPDAISRPDRLLGRLLARPIYLATSGGLALGAFVWMVGSCEASLAEGWPREEARVVAVKERSSFLGCGRGSGTTQRDITWVSPGAPEGLPQRFTTKDECLDVAVGDARTVVRVIGDDGKVDIQFDPPENQAVVLMDAVAVAGFSFVAILTALYLRLWWIRFVAWCRVARRR
ncbi:hypothetical protein ACLM5J_14005 [Nocardioides sp. Bht2]|uniref:hypothetical protein n=1 Tax=Nocardioides sp. Bht2 TaxID=3392297 RepID=UPI0039B3EC81